MRPQAAAKIPHSWAVADWPDIVYPGSPKKARYTIRVNLESLIRAGALTRIGRELVVIGAGYSAWLAKNAGRVEDFDIAPNRKVVAAEKLGA
jgi:hypothetical protein